MNKEPNNSMQMYNFGRKRIIFYQSYEYMLREQTKITNSRKDTSHILLQGGML